MHTPTIIEVTRAGRRVTNVPVRRVDGQRQRVLASLLAVPFRTQRRTTAGKGQPR